MGSCHSKGSRTYTTKGRNATGGKATNSMGKSDEKAAKATEFETGYNDIVNSPNNQTQYDWLYNSRLSENEFRNGLVETMYMENSATGESPVKLMREQADMYNRLAKDVKPKQEAEAIKQFNPNISKQEIKSIENEYQGSKQAYKDLAAKREKIISDMMSVLPEYEARKSKKVFAYIPSVNKRKRGK